MRRNKTLKFVSLLFALVLAVAFSSVAVATQEKPYIGYGKFDTGGIGYKEFGALRGAIYGAMKEAGPEAYPLDYIASQTGLSKKTVAARINRMVEKEYLAPLMSIQVNDAKFFPYYVYYAAIKLKPDTTAAQKKAFTNSIRDDKIFCTSYETKGDFDYWAGYHVESWETWYKLVRPYLENDIVESYTLLPASAQVRHGMSNAYAVPEKDMMCDVAYPSNFDALPAVTKGKLTADDVKIIRAWNKKLPLDKQFNWKKIAKISGQSEKDLISLLAGLRESKILLGPFWAFNWKALGVKRDFLFVQLKNATVDSKRVAMLYDFARANDFNLVYYHSDSLIKFTLIAPEGLADLEQCKNKIKSICGDSLVKIHQAEEVQQLRWWTRLWYPEKFNQSGGVYIYKD